MLAAKNIWLFHAGSWAIGMKWFEAGVGGMGDKERRVADGGFIKSVKVGKRRQEADDEDQEVQNITRDVSPA